MQRAVILSQETMMEQIERIAVVPRVVVVQTEDADEGAARLAIQRFDADFSSTRKRKAEPVHICRACRAVANCAYHIRAAARAQITQRILETQIKSIVGFRLRPWID